MKIINLDKILVDKFYLGENLYRYKLNEADKKYYIKSIQSLNVNGDNYLNLIKIFKNILKKQNKIVVIKKEDISGLFNYFNYKFL